MGTSMQAEAETVLVGRYDLPGGRFDGGELMPVSARELLATQVFLEDTLGTFHFPGGARILLASTMDQAAVYYPFEQAAMTLGLVVCSAEPTVFDAGRVESIIRRLDPVAVFGVTTAMLEGLDALGYSPEKLFFGRVVFGYPAVWDRLDAADGVTLRRWREIGPALTLECTAGDGFHYDAREWSLEKGESGGEIRLTSRLPRALPFRGAPTGLTGAREDAACSCGLLQPRVRT